MGGLGESVEKGKFVMKIFVQMLNEVIESSKKLISANVKADVKQQEIKELVAVSFDFSLKVSSKLEIPCKLDIFFKFNFG